MSFEECAGTPGASGNCFKVVLLGDAGVGKTCLIQALKHDHRTWELSNEYKPTQWAWVTYFDVSDSCRLLIYDSSGRQEAAPLVQLYLRQLHCVIFAFALDDLSSFKRLEYWYQVFNDAFLGDVSTVSKFVIGTKMDLAWSSTELQTEAKAFAEAISAEMWVTSAATAFNTRELFTRISECAACMSYGCFWTFQKQVAKGGKSSYLLDDNLMGKGALVSYPDPIPLNTNGVQITDIMMTYQCVTMETEEGTTFKWGTWSRRRSQEAEMKVNSQRSFTCYGSGSMNTLWSCVLSKAPPSTWQHESLSGEIVLGTTIWRQPTRTMFKDFKKLLFSSRDMDGRERSNRFFYMLLLTEEDSLFDCGLSSSQTEVTGAKLFEKTVVQLNHFEPKPKPLHLPFEGKVSCVSVSKSHAAVVVGSDKAVLTWGRGRDGALGLEEHLVLNFNPPSPLRVTTINCKVNQVACGVDFTLLLTSEGQVYSCGSGKMGKLGHGDETDRLLPTLIENLWNIQAIATGSDHALALTIRGSLYQWGLECAKETLATFNATPTRVTQIDNVKVKAVTCGTHHSVCVANGIWYSGIPYAWGKGTDGQLGLGDCRALFVPRYIPKFYDNGVNVVQVSAGRKHTGFLTKDGDVYTCGSNEFGQLGFFTASGYSAAPVKVDLTSNAVEAKDRVTGLCCHEDYTMICTEHGNVVVWGKCFYGPKIGESVSINPIDVAAPQIMDVTTCHLPLKDAEESIIELVLGLTSTSSLVLCAGITCEFDCQVMVDCKPLIPCDKAGLTAFSSVGPVLVAVDGHGKCFYTNIYEWVKQLIGDKCENLVHLLCCVLKETQSNKVPPIPFKPISSLPGNVSSVESSLTSFLFCTDVGDVYSWSPLLDGKLVHHNELNGQIVVQVACGASHFVALTDDGVLFACGNGSAGQLGHGTFESVEKFQVVSLTQFERVRNVCCGWASTVALTLDGKVFFWGQLDVPRGEKRHNRLASISTKQRIPEFVPTLQENQGHEPDATPATAYKVKFTDDAVLTDKHLAIAGRPFHFEIVPRDEDIVNSSYMEFRVDSVNLQDSHDAHSKGKIKHCQESKGAYSVSIGFHSVGVFKVCVTRNGNHIFGSPFRVNVENGARVSRCKVSLIGCDIECLRAVGGVLQQLIISRDLAMELWGIPSITTDLQTHEACMLSSVTDAGIFIYVWDACYANLSEENLNVWLHLLKLHAPSAEVLILGINCSATCANEIDMTPFRKVNPRLTQAIFTGTSFLSDPKELLEEFQILANQATCRQELVWDKFENLALKIVQKKKSGVEILNERNTKSLAAECGIHGGFLLKQAVNFLQLVGLGLFIGTDEFFFMIQHQWLARHLTGIAKSSHDGTLDSSNLDKPKQHLVDFLTIKGMAVRGLQGNKIVIMHFLSTIAAENWPLVAASDYTAYRHLILSRPPIDLHFIFQRLVAHVLQLYDIVSLGKYSLVIQTEQYSCRLDLGPCLLNKTVAEIRVTVRASTQELCAVSVECTVDQLRGLLNEIIDPSELEVKVSCNICRRQFLDVAAVNMVEEQENTHLTCVKCGDNKVSAGNLLRGFKETRPFPDMIWNPFPETSKQGTPPSLQALMTPLMRYFGDRGEWQSRRLLQEIRGMMRDIAKVFADTKYYTTPRTICLLPEFQRSSVLKCNAIKMIQTWGQPKYRLFLLCEGNGDGTGVHFLGKKQHQGYLLESSIANGLISNSVDLLRFGLQQLMTVSPLLSLSRSLGYFIIEDSGHWETLNNVLGLVGLSGATLCQVPWKSHFKEMDAFLKSFQDTAKSIHQPKTLSELSTPGVGHQVSGDSYLYLRKLLSDLGTKDDFGGLRQEVREGIGAIWVCDKHSRNSSSTKAIKVMP